MASRATPVVRRVRDSAEVEDLCGHHQPVGLLVSSPLGEADAAHRTRCWAVGGEGRELGLLTAVRVRPGLVTASALLLDPAGAPALAALVRRSGAMRLIGGADHVEPVAALIPGARTTALDLLARREVVRLEGTWRDQGRVARPEDVPALIALYRRFELEIVAPSRLPEAISGLVGQRRVVVALDDGAVVAAQRIEARSCHWDLWAGLSVLPEHRGQGLSRVIDAIAREVSSTAGRGTAGIRALTNHVPHRATGLTVHPWREIRVAHASSVPRRAWRRAQRELTAAGARR